MWIFKNNAFVSIVAHRDEPGTMIMRARKQGDLERFVKCTNHLPLWKLKVQHTPDADYPFRAHIDAAYLQDIMCDMVNDIDYTNFKGSIEYNAENDLRYEVYSEVWAMMMRWGLMEAGVDHGKAAATYSADGDHETDE